jgi:hypothetical protein
MAQWPYIQYTNTTQKRAMVIVESMVAEVAKPQRQRSGAEPQRSIYIEAVSETAHFYCGLEAFKAKAELCFRQKKKKKKQNWRR